MEGQHMIKPTDEITLKALYMNVRGMNSSDKKSAIKDMISSIGQIDLVSLSETKLTHTFKLPGWRHIQTSMRRNGGCWAASSSSERTKMIKTLGTGISWMSAAYLFVPVHIFTVYLAPYHT